MKTTTSESVTSDEDDKELPKYQVPPNVLLQFEDNPKLKEYAKVTAKVLWIKHGLMEAIVQERRDRFKPLLRRLQKVKNKVTKTMLGESAIGMLLNDKAVWPEELHSEVERLLTFFRTLVKDRDDPIHGPVAKLPDHHKPFRGMKYAKFSELVDQVFKEVVELDICAYEVPQMWRREAAVAVVTWGFNSAKDMVGLDEVAVAALHSHPTVRSILVRVGEENNRRAAYQREVRLRRSVAAAAAAQSVVDDISLSAESMAEQLDNASIQADWGLVQDTQERMGVPRFQDQSIPRKRLAVLMDAVAASPQQVMEMLQEQAEVMKRKSRLATASTASGLKLWHNFAVGVLLYPPSNTLPPQKPADILKFSYLFNNKGTAANYIGTIKWACDNKGLSVDWYDGEVKQLLKGVTNVANIYFDGAMGAEFLLEQTMVNKLLLVFKGYDQWREVIITTVGWEYLLRMQSEAMVVYIGKESDSYQLPEGRDNGLWIDPDGQFGYA